MGSTAMRSVMRRWLVMSALVLMLGNPVATAAEELQGTLQLKGSDTMVNLCQAWAEAFMAKHPRVTIAVTGGGSGTGIAALIAGTCDLAAASRKMTPKEIALAQAHNHQPQEWTVGLDGLVVVVHPKNPVKQLTLDQLARLFTGTMHNWRELGGTDATVLLLSREVNSGTHVYFKEHVLGTDAKGHSREFAPEALLMPSSQAIADEVATNTAAIGYYGMGYLNPRNAAVAIAPTAAGPFLLPTEALVREGTYPISRPLFLYSREALQGLTKTFMEYVMSPEGQEIVRRTDFVPVSAP